MKRYFDLKDGICLDDICMLHPNLIIMFGTVLNFASKNNLPVVVTSMVGDRGSVKAVSKTHEQGRALDLSVKGWSHEKIEELNEIIDKKHSDIGAISAKTLKPRPFVFHNYRGQGDHIHLQVKP